MLNVQTVLDRLKIDSTSLVGAIQDISTLIESSDNPISTARSIITNVADIEFNTNDPIEARMIAQRLVQDALLLGEKYDPTMSLERAAKKIAEQRVTNPWFFFKNQGTTVVSTTETREGVNVEIKTDGKIKKGGKQVMAAALYEKHKALSNQEIITIFMKELDMSKPGATTYLYNAKKAVK